MARMYEFVVGPNDAGLRLDQFLVRHTPLALSRSAIQRAIGEEAVTVGGRPTKPHRTLKVGDAVAARFSELPAPSQSLLLHPEPIPLDIVYEDEAVLVVNKPAGLVTHPAPGHWSGTLVNALLWHFQQPASQRDRGEALPRAGLVHRLDKDTSGLLIVAKSLSAMTALAKQLKNRTLGRRYLALVDGHVACDEGTVDVAIGRHAKDRKIMTVRYLGGRQAVTRYRVLQRFGAPRKKVRIPAEPTLDFPYSLLLAELQTGRTHQIRVHFKAINHPIVSDALYAPGLPPALGFERLALHAFSLTLPLISGKTITVEAPYPEDFKRGLEQFKGEQG